MVASNPTLTWCYVVRLVTPPGKIFPVQEYLRVTDPDEWTRDAAQAPLFPAGEADELAKARSTRDCHVFPVIPRKRSEPAMPARDFSSAQRADWHAGKPNCGVE